MLRPAASLSVLAAAVLAVAILAGCASRPGAEAAGAGPSAPAAFTDIGYASWRPDEPAYRLYPGDVLDVTVPSAPELNRTVTVEPDGRISLPLIAPAMAADRSVIELESGLTEAYASQLVHPVVQVDVKTATPLRVFVGGEVGKPGVYDMPGDIDALQAVMMAGGFTPLAKSTQVVIVRRGPDGRLMMRTADLRRATFHAGQADAVPLRRFDVIFVPRTTIANLGLFVQQYIREVVPLQFSYAVTPNAYATVP